MLISYHNLQTINDWIVSRILAIMGLYISQSLNYYFECENEQISIQHKDN